MDRLKESISDKIAGITNGSVNLDSLTSGQIKFNGDAYVDKLMDKLNEELQKAGLESIGLPSQQVHFAKSIACGITIPADADLRNGLISGLSSFCRFDDAELKIDVFSDPIITANVEVGLKRAAVDYGVGVKAFCLQQNGSIVGSVNNIKISLCLKVGRNLSVKVDKFDIQYSGDMSFNFRGLDGLMELTNSMDAELRNSVKEAVVKYLTENVKTHIISAVKNVTVELLK